LFEDALRNSKPGSFLSQFITISNNFSTCSIDGLLFKGWIKKLTLSSGMMLNETHV